MSFLVQLNEFQEFYRFISGIHNYVLYSVWLNLVCTFRYFFQAAISKKYECALKVWSITVLRISHMNGFNVNCRCVHLWRKMSWYLTKNVTSITQRELALLMLEEQYRARANVQNHFCISFHWIGFSFSFYSNSGSKIHL